MEDGDVLDEVPFNGELKGLGPQVELGYRIQRGILLPQPSTDSPPQLDVIPRAIHHDGVRSYPIRSYPIPHTKQKSEIVYTIVVSVFPFPLPPHFSSGSGL